MPKKKILKKRVFHRHSQKNGDAFSLDSFRESLKKKSKAELLDMIVSIVDDHDPVYKKFEQAAEVKAARQSDTPENLFKKAKALIDKGTRIDRDDPYFKKIGFGGPELHLKPLDEVVKLLAKNRMPETFSILQKITAYLLEKGKHYFDESLGAETAFDYENSFETIAKAVIDCKENAEQVLAWAEETKQCDMNCITGHFYSMLEKAYRKKSNSGKKT